MTNDAFAMKCDSQMATPRYSLTCSLAKGHAGMHYSTAHFWDEDAAVYDQEATDEEREALHRAITEIEA